MKLCFLFADIPVLFPKMSDKKTAAMTPERNDLVPPQAAFYASSFRIITDAQSNGLLEILLQPGVGPFPVICVIFDLISFRDNKQTFTRYLSELPGSGDDSAINEKIPYSTTVYFSGV